MHIAWRQGIELMQFTDVCATSGDIWCVCAGVLDQPAQVILF